MSEELYLHETPVIRACFKRLACLLRGGHRHIYIGRTLLDTGNYSLHYVCTHCRHFQWQEARPDA